jgi:hypothetical protein
LCCYPAAADREHNIPGSRSADWAVVSKSVSQQRDPMRQQSGTKAARAGIDAAYRFDDLAQGFEEPFAGAWFLALAGIHAGGGDTVPTLR